MFPFGYASIVLLASLAVFLPLAFGATQPWSIFVFEATAITAFLAWLINSAGERYIAIKKTWLYVPVAIMLAVFFLQVVPMPADFVKAVSPAAYEFRAYASGFCGKTFPHAIPLSLNADATLNELVKAVCMLMVFFLAAHAVNSVRRAEKILGLVFVLGFLTAVFAIIQKFSWNGRIYWLADVPSNSSPFGPFVNYDHYGGYMNLLIMAGFGFILSGIRTEKKILAGFMTAVMGASLFLSNSRGAVLSFAGGLFVLSILIFTARRNYEKKTLGALLGAALFIVAVTFVLMYWIDWAQFTGRLRTILRLESNFFNPRLDIWKDSLRMVKDFPVSGVGLGVYGMVFPAYQTTHLYLFWRYTHCDYLQLLIESGPLPLLCALTFTALLFSAVFRKLSASRNAHLSGLLAGCAAGVATMVLHSAVDFNMHITSNGYLAALIGGIAFALTRISRERDTDLFEVVFSKRGSILAMAGGTAAACLLLFPSLRAYAAFHSYSRSLRATEHYIPFMEKAVRTAPGNALYHNELGSLYQDESFEVPAADQGKLLHMARTEFCKAVLLSPAEGSYWSSLAWNLANLGENERSRGALSRAVRVAPFRPEIREFKDNYDKTFGS